ncbi:MAG: Rho termination factor N-terminal domain-containing protein [bacterium]|nr:Rho termination factor N-terminal domain-containing protein [bacterium]
MDYTYKDLKQKTVAQLREIASGIEHEAVQGYTQLNKDHLLEAICKALNIDMYQHRRAVGVDKAKIKVEIRKLKRERDRLLEEKGDSKKLKKVRKEIKLLKNKLRRALVVTQ